MYLFLITVFVDKNSLGFMSILFFVHYFSKFYCGRNSKCFPDDMGLFSFNTGILKTATFTFNDILYSHVLSIAFLKITEIIVAISEPGIGCLVIKCNFFI